MSPREQRAIRNEELFRQVNLRIAELQEGSHDLTLEGLMPLVCECSHTGCTVPVEIDPAIFERVRKNPLQYVVAPGHEDLEVETVVERRDAYLVVQKRST